MENLLISNKAVSDSNEVVVAVAEVIGFKNDIKVRKKKVLVRLISI